MTSYDYIPYDGQITFDLRLNNSYGITVGGLGNGFRVYSPDGADWTSTMADTFSAGWNDRFDFDFKIILRNTDGIASDTVAYSGLISMGTGLENGFNEEAYRITVGPFQENDIGKTICIDSSNFAPPFAGRWEWSDDFGYVSFPPDWDGPHCFTIRGDSITYYGYIYYYDPTLSPPDYRPARNCRIVLWDSDIIGDDSLATAVAESDGSYQIGPVDNSDILGKLDTYLRIYPENEATYLTGAYNGNRVYLQTQTQNDVPGGEYENTFFLTPVASGPFFVADAILDAKQVWEQMRPNDQPPQVQTVWTTNDNMTFYDTTQHALHISDKVDASMALRDTWDRGVIYHEYAHALQHAFGFFFSGGGMHEWLVATSLGTASLEGSATFLANILLDSPVLE